jgi:ABC-2 type transport system permease protein
MEPLGLSIILWMVFSVLLGPRNLGLQPYLLFLSVAMLPWWWFTKGVNSSVRSFRRNVAQLRISTLPTQFWVLRILLVSTVEFVMSLPVIVIAIILTRDLPGPFIIFFPIAILAQFLFMYGIALALASWNVIAPDVARLVRLVLRGLFYLSPILYSVSNIPEHVRPLAALNPLVGILGLYRIGWWPQEIEDMVHYGLSLGIGAMTFVIGWIVFRRLESRVLKES